MIARFFGGLVDLRALAVLGLVLLAFACGWVLGGNNAMVESEGEVATMATPQEVEEFRWLIDAEKDESLREEDEIGGATNLTRVDQYAAATATPDC